MRRSKRPTDDTRVGRVQKYIQEAAGVYNQLHKAARVMNDRPSGFALFPSLAHCGVTFSVEYLFFNLNSKPGRYVCYSKVITD